MFKVYTGRGYCSTDGSRRHHSVSTPLALMAQQNDTLILHILCGSLELRNVSKDPAFQSNLSTSISRHEVLECIPLLRQTISVLRTIITL